MAGAARRAVGRPAGRGRRGHRRAPGAACWRSCPTSATSTRCTTPASRLVDESRVVALSAGLGPAQRYRRWLSVLRGSARLVIGTRSAVFAPVADLGLVLVWDDGDDTLAEPRAPYPHAREVGNAARAPIALCRNDRRILPHRRGAGAGAQPMGARPGGGQAGGAVPGTAGDRAGGQRIRPGARPGRAQRPVAVDGAAGRADGARRRAPGPGPGAAQGLRARAGLRPLPHHRPLQALHRPAVAARSGRRGCGVPVVRPRGTRAALRPMRIRRGPRRRRRRPPHRRGTRPGVPRHHRRHLRRRHRGADGARRSGARRRHAGCRAGGRGRLRRRAAAGRLGAAGPSGSACGRGHAAPLDGRRHAGALPRRRRRGRRGRRIGGADRAGADPLGPGRARRGRARRPRRGGPAARRAHGRRGRRAGRRGRTAGNRRTARLRASCSGPSTCRREPADPPAPRPTARSAGCWSGCPAPTGWSWRRRCGGPPGCSAPGTISSRFGCKSTRCT